MTIRIDGSGRIAIPQPLQERLGLKPDSELDLTELNEGFLLRPIRRRASITLVDGFWRHNGLVTTGFDWGRQLQIMREKRIQCSLF